MSTDDLHKYRERIYGRYDSARQTPVAPKSVAGLKVRLPLFGWLIRQHMPVDRHCSILDLGCGHGALLYALERAGYRNARGVDGSPEQVEAARRLGVAGVELGDVLATLLAAPAASFDVVIAFDVIEHYTKSELIPLVDAVLRVLKPGGRWIIHAPNAESPLSGRIRYGDITHELAFTRVSLDQLLRASGFSSVGCFEDRPVPHGVKSTIRAFLWHVIRSALLVYVAIEVGAFDRRAVFSQNLLAVAFKSTEI
jgi:2-polyprenyl-3-methyl-5-hydroxy-6-metoxy-1,4-benzoquinol methylase